MTYHLPKPDYQFYTKNGTITTGTYNQYPRQDIIGWRIKFTCDTNFPSSWREIWLGEELPKMYKNKADINIMLSGGSDSLTTALGFIECGYDVNHTIVLYKDYDHICNAREVKEAFKFAGKHRIKYDVIEHNVCDFFDEWINDPKWHGYSTNIMDSSLQMWSVSKIDQSLFTIISEPGFTGYIKCENDWMYRNVMDNQHTQEVFTNLGFNGTTRPYWTSPKALTAFFAGDVSERILYDNVFNLSPGEMLSTPELKYKAWSMLSGLNVTPYVVPKTSVQMFDKHKWLKKWHKAMVDGLINISHKNLQLEYSMNDFHQRIKNGSISDYWIDFKDWAVEAPDTWYGPKLDDLHNNEVQAHC